MCEIRWKFWMQLNSPPEPFGKRLTWLIELSVIPPLSVKAGRSFCGKTKRFVKPRKFICSRAPKIVSLFFSEVMM